MSNEIKRFDADHIEGYAEYPGGRFCEYSDAEQCIKTLEKENKKLKNLLGKNEWIDYENDIVFLKESLSCVEGEYELILKENTELKEQIETIKEAFKRSVESTGREYTKLENKLDNFYFALEPPKIKDDEKRSMHQILLYHIKQLQKKADMWKILKKKINMLPGSEVYIKNMMEEMENGTPKK